MSTLAAAAPGGRATGILRRASHLLRSEYFSGGGGETIEHHVPKDPQAHVRLFVPKDRKDKEHET